MRPRRVAFLLVFVLLLAGCAGGADDPAEDALRPTGPDSFGQAPAVPNGPLDDRVEADIELILSRIETNLDVGAVTRIGASGDARLAWLLSDLLRFVQVGTLADSLLASFQRLTDTELPAADRSWTGVTNRLIAWDLPSPPGYVDYKARLFVPIEPGWAPFFEDPNADIDWRLVSWGGVRIDDRRLGDPNPCFQGCIPALDDPGVTDADGGSWYSDDALVFGVVVSGEARAYPKNIMEVHEMVNDTLGGRRIGMPYCTLCGSAQAYFTDTVGDQDLVLRTSGLLSRSNKVTYELNSKSVVDTFTGRALSGPLHDQGVELEQISVVRSTWGAWKEAHPDTTVVAQDGGIGRQYPEDPLGGRDDNGPIFPIGGVDPRLPVQHQVVGVIAPDRTPLAFPADEARIALQAGSDVELGGVHLELDGDGLRALLADGSDAVSHQAFWFAWSQFHPTTAVWMPPRA